MTKLKFGTEQEGVEFAGKVQAVISYLINQSQLEHAGIVRKLMSDNISLFNRLEELEDEPVTKKRRNKETDSGCN